MLRRPDQADIKSVAAEIRADREKYKGKYGWDAVRPIQFKEFFIRYSLQHGPCGCLFVSKHKDRIFPLVALHCRARLSSINGTIIPHTNTLENTLLLLVELTSHIKALYKRDNCTHLYPK